MLGTFGAPDSLRKYQTIFIDSTTNAARYCLQWAKGQPEAFSDRSGKQDMRGAYGLLGREITAWVTQWQYIPNLNVWLVGGLEEKSDDFNRRYWHPMIDGSKGASELPYERQQFASSITTEQAEALLRQDVQTAERAVLRLITVPLTNGQFDALVSFTFNRWYGRSGGRV